MKYAFFGEKDVDIFDEGEEKRLGQIWPKKWECVSRLPEDYLEILKPFERGRIGGLA